MYSPSRENPLHPSEAHPPPPSDASVGPSDDAPSRGDDQDVDGVIVTPDDARQRQDLDVRDRETGTGDARSDPLASDASDGRPEVGLADGRDVVEENGTQCAADINDDVDATGATAKAGQVKGGSRLRSDLGGNLEVKVRFGEI